MRFIKPDAYYVSMTDIDPEALREAGYRAVLLDLDNTVLPRASACLSAEVIAWFEALKATGLKAALVSNTAGARAYDAAHVLGVPLVRNALKPFSRGYVAACAALGVACHDAVMIGDQSYTDVLGAHRVGMDAILVVPQNATDPLHTYLLRTVDHLAVRGMRAHGGM